MQACLVPYLVAAASRILDAWGRLDDETRRRIDRDVHTAAVGATRRVTAELRALLAVDPARQAATPLELVRSAVREPTEVLRAAGVPAIVRDDFEERAWPDDDYGLTPRAVGDLGDPDLGPVLLAWGLAKSSFLRARAAG